MILIYLTIVFVNMSIVILYNLQFIFWDVFLALMKRASLGLKKALGSLFDPSTLQFYLVIWYGDLILGSVVFIRNHECCVNPMVCSGSMPNSTY